MKFKISFDRIKENIKSFGLAYIKDRKKVTLWAVSLFLILVFVILGVLRGLAHAGAKGNKEAIISAGSIEANQIRISNIVRECEKEEVEDDIIKTNAFLSEEDKIIIE